MEIHLWDADHILKQASIFKQVHHLAAFLEY